MSDETTDPTDEAVSDFEPITSQDALDRIIGQRIDRVKKQYAGFEELKAKAAKFDEFQEASKSELERATERANQLEAELASERDKTGRQAVAATKGVPVSMITGTTPEEWEASADAALEWRGTQEEKPPPKKARGLKSGATGVSEIADPKERAAAAMRLLRNNP